MERIAVVINGEHTIQMPVVFSTKKGAFVVVSNAEAKVNMSFDPARRNPYIVVHRESGLRVPRPADVSKMLRFEAGAVARWLSRNAVVENGVVLVNGAPIDDRTWRWNLVAPKGRESR